MLSRCTCHFRSDPAMLAGDAIQRAGSPARTGCLSFGEGEGLDSLLCESWPSTSDSRRLPRRQRGPNRHMSCNLASGRSAAKVTNRDHATVFTDNRSDPRPRFLWFLLPRSQGIHRYWPLRRGLPLQGTLGNGRSPRDAARARFTGAGSESQSDDRDSERSEATTRVISALLPKIRDDS